MTARRWAGAACVLALGLGGCATPASKLGPMPVPPPPVPATGAAIAPEFQYLYGSGEAVAATVGSWNALVAFVRAQTRARPFNSAVLGPDATLTTPRFVPCGDKPFAAVFDVDETVLLNLGFESWAATHRGPYDAKLWSSWEQGGIDRVAPTPGAREALSALRAAGVTVIFNTNRFAANAAATEAALNRAGLGPAVHGRTLFLAGDDATGSHKDGRRATIAARYCVLALGGDQLGDFSDLFNAGLSPAARRLNASTGRVAAMWNAGWFVFPNPVYGSALRGGLDEAFPTDKRWAPPAEEK